MAKKPARSTANDATAASAPAVSKPRGRTAKLSSQAAGPENISGVLTEPEYRTESADRVHQAPGDAMAARSFDAPTDEEIRARAYEMYLERGGDHGLDFDDWVRAERELKRQQ
jgi:Protein of unknown function (DUF2934)